MKSRFFDCEGDGSPLALMRRQLSCVCCKPCCHHASHHHPEDEQAASDNFRLADKRIAGTANGKLT
jgi:hypothetical protein